MYGLQNAYLRVGTFVLQQCKVITMGSPLSPMLAILYCPRIESYFLNTLTTNIRFNSIRYIDDILIILSGRGKDMKKGKIYKLINIMKWFCNNNSEVVLEIEEKG